MKRKKIDRRFVWSPMIVAIILTVGMLMSPLMYAGAEESEPLSEPYSMPEEQQEIEEMPVENSEEVLDPSNTDEPDMVPVEEESEAGTEETTVTDAEPPATQRIARAPQHNGLPTTLANDVQVTTGTELRNAVNSAPAGELRTITLMNDIILGENIGLAHGRTDGDGDASALKPPEGANILLRSGKANNEKVTIYRVDRARHFEISGQFVSSGQNIIKKNVNVAFDRVVLNGLQTYDPMAVVSGQLSTSSRGGIDIHYAENITVTGAEVRNCFSEVQNCGITHTSGGGLGTWYVKNLLLEGCVFEDNISGTLGGAIDLSITSATVRNCKIKNNSAERPWDSGRGGGICINGDSVSPNTILIENCEITGNLAKGWASPTFLPHLSQPSTSTTADYGGGICIWNYADVTITNCNISNNTADYGGGIMSLTNYGFTINGNTKINDNKALNEHVYVGDDQAYTRALGGAIYHQVGPLNISGNVEINNNIATSQNGTSYGGGLYLLANETTLDGNVEISGNKAQGSYMGDYGGGVFLMPSGSYPASLTATGTGIKLANNEAVRGGAVYSVYRENTAEVSRFTGTTFTGNKALIKAGSTSEFDGSGGAIYAQSRQTVLSDGASFVGNRAQKGGFYLEDPPDDEAATLIGVHNTNIKNTKSLSAPFMVAYQDYAYNNHDINYTEGTPPPQMKVEYYKDSATTGQLLLTEKLGEVSRHMAASQVLETSGLGAGWLDKYRPQNYKGGELVNALPNKVGKTDLTVQVVYAKTSTTTTTTTSTTSPGSSSVPESKSPPPSSSSSTSESSTLPPASSSSGQTRPPAIRPTTPASVQPPESSASDSNTSRARPAAGTTPTSSSATPPASAIPQEPQTPGTTFLDIIESPLSRFISHWSLLNVIIMFLCIAVSVVMLVRRLMQRNRQKKNKANRPVWWIFTLAIGPLAMLTVWLTQNFRADMAIADAWTPLMVVLLLAQLAMVILMKRSEQDKHGDDSEPLAMSGAPGM